MNIISNLKDEQKFCVIVIGGGHAGVEAACVASRISSKVLLITQKIEDLGEMSCNPAIGGIGKGHLVKEIDAMGGIMAKAADRSCIQIRTINNSKGPAVQATRSQADRKLYKKAIGKIINDIDNLFVFQQSVFDLIIENNKVIGVITQSGIKFYANSVVLAVGTFLGGKIHIGNEQYGGGRAGAAPTIQLAQRLRSLPHTIDRLKTGTPPRIDARSIDYSKLEKQHSDYPLPIFSFMGKSNEHPQQIACHITHTNIQTHSIITNSLADSPLYNGNIESIGPRYCPSIEDKVVKFSSRDSHQIFLEPEGLESNEVYPNGISTSLPFAVQYDLVRSIHGLENAFITRPGYAIEYDFLDPRDLNSSLESKYIENLFLAGQINGTTGYEEAAAQGLVAGINGALKAQNKPLWVPKRSECYIGVLISDLITRGTSEPYRMFTSRAEYRLSLREDNADERLTPIGYKIGTVSDKRWQHYCNKQNKIQDIKNKLKAFKISPQSDIANYLCKQHGVMITKAVSGFDILKRPEVTYAMLKENIIFLHSDDIATEISNQIQIQAKYSGYLQKQQQEIQRQQKYEKMIIPKKVCFANISGLSNEIVEKLNKYKPETIEQASRIAGITPAAISLLTVYLKKFQLA